MVPTVRSMSSVSPVLDSFVRQCNRLILDERNERRYAKMAEYRDNEMNWSVETYRLDEVEHKFKLPVVIFVNEGYYSATDTEGFSSGDIMSIDKKVVLHKVAANFAYENRGSKLNDDVYVRLVENEIFVPLNYRGRLKILKPEKNYESVSELARDFPRYAKLRINWKMKTEENVVIEVKAGTVIELDRIIPGSTYGTKIEPDKLVVMFRHLKKDIMVAMPYTDKAKFRTEPDNNQYTIKEAIDRYSLPQLVKFVDDEIRRVYSQDLMDGIANMKTITETLRLNRLLTQTVLVGHYKPVEEPSSYDPTDVRKRTLIVIPLDNKEIREIEVNVLLDATEDDYERILGVRNVSNTDGLVDGLLYVDFARPSPGISRISHELSFVNRDTEKMPPPVPPKPSSMQHKAPIFSLAGVYSNTFVDRDTEKMPPPVPPKPSSMQHKAPSFSLAEVYFNSPVSLPLQTKIPKKKQKKLLEFISKKQKDKTSEARNQPKSPEEDALYKEPEVLPAGAYRKEIHEDDCNPYDTVDEEKMDSEFDYNNCNYYKTTLKPRLVHSASADNSPELPKSPRAKKVARVQPKTRAVCTERKLFKDLCCEELVARLRFCGLLDFARLCETEQLNGAFFQNISPDILKETMNLKGIQLAKFIQMRDENWTPSS